VVGLLERGGPVSKGIRYLDFIDGKGGEDLPPCAAGAGQTA
jgi:hypothetical protein